MRAEIISIGDEILNGQILDTNCQWLILRLAELGVPVLYHSAMRDDLAAMVEIFRAASQRADLVISTGGLGPTADDLTREALAQAAGVSLVRNAEALAHIRELFARRKRPMPPSNELQADFPAGSRIVPNPHGTAPGIALAMNRPGLAPSQFFALPGVPAEMREMWYGTVEREVRQLGGGQKILRTRNIKLFGAGESQVEALVPELIARERYPRVGINASQATIILRVTAEGATEEECDAAMEPTVREIYEKAGHLIYAEGSDELQHAVTKLLRQSGRRLALAEWGTGGQLAQWLAAVPDAEGFYLGAIEFRDLQGLGRLLGVPAALADTHGTASAEVASRMAVECRTAFASELALAIAPFPPTPAATATATAAPPTMYVALADSKGARVDAFPFALHPALLNVYTAKRALDLVRRYLTEQLKN